MSWLEVRMEVEFQGALKADKMQVTVRDGPTTSRLNSLFCSVSSEHATKW